MEYLLEELGLEMRNHAQGREEVAGAHTSLQDIGSPDVAFKDMVLALLGPLGVLLVLNSYPLRRRTFNPLECFLLSEQFVLEHLRVPILCHQPVSLLFQEELILRQVFHLDASIFRTLGNLLLLLFLLLFLLLKHPSFFLLLECQLPSPLILGHLSLLFLLLSLSFGLLLCHPAHLLLNFKFLSLLLISLLLLPQFHLHLKASLLFFLD